MFLFLKFKNCLTYEKSFLNNNSNKYQINLISIKRNLHFDSKKQQGGTKSFFKGILFLEVGLFFGSYLLWKRMNNSQEFRYYLNKNFPSILEGSTS